MTIPLKSLAGMPMEKKPVLSYDNLCLDDCIKYVGDIEGAKGYNLAKSEFEPLDLVVDEEGLAKKLFEFVFEANGYEDDWKNAHKTWWIAQARAFTTALPSLLRVERRKI